MSKRFTIIGENYTNIDMPVFIVCREDDCCFEVYESKEEAQIVCDKLNNLIEENEQLKSDVYDWKASAEDYLKLGKSLKEENEQLKKQLFEARRDYLIETADISDKLYLDDEIEKERREIFGDVE